MTAATSLPIGVFLMKDGMRSSAHDLFAEAELLIIPFIS